SGVQTIHSPGVLSCGVSNVVVATANWRIAEISARASSSGFVPIRLIVRCMFDWPAASQTSPTRLSLLATVPLWEDRDSWTGILEATRAGKTTFHFPSGSTLVERDSSPS